MGLLKISYLSIFNAEQPNEKLEPPVTKFKFHPFRWRNFATQAISIQGESRDIQVVCK